MKYRPDIDGLRALAVLAVVGFHAFPGSIRGGFIGVDIFFVISGYLIGTIIFQSLQDGTFSFLDFYSRRIRRIFPALILVLASSLVFGWFYLLVNEYKQLGKHVAAGAGFVSNFVFWNEAGYFDNAADTKPLLHLWSLGIEEQFYIVWPLLLWFTWKRKINLLVLTVVIAIISFALNLYFIKQDPIATFYSPLTRIWELLSGSLLAYIVLHKKNISYALHNRFEKKFSFIKTPLKLFSVKSTFTNLTSLAGALTLAYALRRINNEQPFPGLWAALPVLGTILIIASGSHSWFNRIFLSNKLLVSIGIISFPLYLWHWPLLSFNRIVGGEQHQPAYLLVFIIALSIFFAWLTYRFIERPIRQKNVNLLNTGALISLMLLVGIIGFTIFFSNGAPGRLKFMGNMNSDLLIKISNAWHFQRYPDPESYGFYMGNKNNVYSIGPDFNNKIVIIGDSHAQQYISTIGTLYKRQSDSIKTSTSFILDDEFPPKIPTKIVADQTITTVVFSYYWAYRYGSKTVNQEVRCCGGGKNFVVANSKVVPHLDHEEMDQIDEQLEKSIFKLTQNGKKVYLILDNPFGEELDPHAMLNRSWLGVKIRQLATLDKSQAELRSEPIKTRLINISKKTGASIIDPIQHLCSPRLCDAFSEEKELLYKDYDHLSVFTLTEKVRYLDPLFPSNK